MKRKQIIIYAEILMQSHGAAIPEPIKYHESEKLSVCLQKRECYSCLTILQAFTVAFPLKAYFFILIFLLSPLVLQNVSKELTKMK